MIKNALGNVSSVLLYTTLYNGKIVTLVRLSTISLTEFIIPNKNKNKIIEFDNTYINM